MIPARWKQDDTGIVPQSHAEAILRPTESELWSYISHILLKASSRRVRQYLFDQKLAIGSESR